MNDAILQGWLVAIGKAASFLRFRSTEVSDVVAEEYLRVSAALTDLECHLADIEPLLKAARLVLEGAESEAWDTYRGTDLPRTGIAELREALTALSPEPTQ